MGLMLVATGNAVNVRPRQENHAALMSGQNDIQPENLEKQQPKVDRTPAHEHGYIAVLPPLSTLI